MPIPVDEVLKAKQPLRERILEFLRAHPKDAFNLPEIVCGLQGPRYDEKFFYLNLLEPDQLVKELDPYLQAIKELEAAGDLLAAEVEGATYYWPKVPF